jgi:hypothetical protein
MFSRLRGALVLAFTLAVLLQLVDELNKLYRKT